MTLNIWDMCCPDCGSSDCDEVQQDIQREGINYLMVCLDCGLNFKLKNVTILEED